jgi:hypothetical protein
MYIGMFCYPEPVWGFFGGGGHMAGGIAIFPVGMDNTSTVYYPAAYNWTFSVASTDHNDVKTPVSNYGSYVSISAPGGSMFDIIGTVIDNGYGWIYGTDVAAAHVAGASALFISHMSRYGLYLTGNQVRNIITQNVDDHYPQNPNYTGQLGSGRLNAHLALLDFPNHLTANIALNSANTTGTHTASQSVTMNPGFESGTSFVAQVYGASKGNVIEIYSGGKLITSFVIDVKKLSVYPDLWDGTDASGSKAEPGEYMYRIFKEEDVVEEGSFIIQKEVYNESK